ncbi:hypothetical protein GCM10011506_01370 [Marivirga lumbricoides]|uniref:Carboxypeptidase regulatory-like domain-containing protein n=1 Tax=Marivirga lumbricoides TaxID=1046115 RepID=A0ABQ1L9I9_9BACT|nr:hypothetical protein GCM10011506_01370 [Marivirga lumbricoides]
MAIIAIMLRFLVLVVSFSFFGSLIKAQSLSGKVSDNRGNPVTAATVTVQTFKKFTFTDEEGVFLIDLTHDSLP